QTFLADDILFKTDRASMATSLEARVPYLDHELVEFAFRVPPSMKLRAFTGKWILRRAFRGRIPPAILRRRKSGFSVPIAAWLRGDLREIAGDLLHPRRIAAQGLFRPDRVDQLRREHESGAADHGRTLWALLMYQLWHDRYAGASVGSEVAAAQAAGAVGRGGGR
ncbi:MAG TPA: asparagine synthase C-terminal domain-containing protein, partial [Dongiaceae bacterium]|nr:asparagine synthase C-terminal domain-containing protein [Dongiaceae bacterium]